MATGPTRSIRLLAAAVVLVVYGATVAGCGSAPPPVDPTGVDELMIPTASPDPSDFVADPTDPNPWLALAPGRVWNLRDPFSDWALRLSVPDAATMIAGVETTTLRTVMRDPTGRIVLDVSDHLAQDDAGNVWRFGRDVETGTGASWRTGTASAGAGLAMPARPRVGDGYQSGFARTDSAIVRVVATTAETSVPAGAYTGVLQTDTETDDGAELRTDYARGIGPLVVSGTALGGRTFELVTAP